MQDSIYHMTLNWHFICFFALRCDFSAISKCDLLRMMMIVQFRPCCQVWRLGPLDLTHKAQRSLQPRHP